MAHQPKRIARLPVANVIITILELDREFTLPLVLLESLVQLLQQGTCQAPAGTRRRAAGRLHAAVVPARVLLLLPEQLAVYVNVRITMWGTCNLAL